MRRGITAGLICAAALLGPTATASAEAPAEPPRGSCNRGTMNAHATVPHETEGNHRAHEVIPHCEH